MIPGLYKKMNLLNLHPGLYKKMNLLNLHARLDPTGREFPSPFLNVFARDAQVRHEHVGV
jgi:hypothetical protein